VETRSINASLSAFNTCLHALWRNQHEAPKQAIHVPVRDSSLTRILADMMNGYGKLVLSVHISQEDADVELSRRTLEFAQRVSQIKTRPEAKAAQTMVVADSAAEGWRLSMAPARRQGAAPQAR
jgi:hypothetical protein